MDLRQRNSLYTTAEPLRIKSRDLFGGSVVIKARGETYLFKEKNETADEYTLRLKRAVGDNYVEKIIQARQAILFMRAPSRDLDSALKVLEDNVDLQNSGATTFFRDVALDAQVDGIRWVLVDMPLVEEQMQSAADEIRAGIRPFFQSVPAAAVIDWGVGADGLLDWAVLEQYATESRNPGEAEKKTLQFKVWYRDHWELHSAETGSVQATSLKVVNQGPNPTGRVPLVPFYGAKQCDFLGLPVCASILDHIVLIYNKQSDLDWFERLYCHPIPYVVSPTKPQKLETQGGFWVQSGPQTGEISVDFLQTSGAGESGVRDSVDRIESRIYAIALAQAKRDTKQVQAADSQREDRRIFTASLKSVSEEIERAEAECWRLAGRWLGAKDAKVVVAYNRDFTDRTIDENFIAELSVMVDDRKLSLKTFLATLEYSDVIPNFDAGEEEKLLAAEAKTRAVELIGDKKPAQTQP